MNTQTKYPNHPIPQLFTTKIARTCCVCHQPILPGEKFWRLCLRGKPLMHDAQHCNCLDNEVTHQVTASLSDNELDEANSFLSDMYD